MDRRSINAFRVNSPVLTLPPHFLPQAVRGSAAGNSCRCNSHHEAAACVLIAPRARRLPNSLPERFSRLLNTRYKRFGGRASNVLSELGKLLGLLSQR